MSVYVGIDVHRKRSQVAVVDQDGEVLPNRNVPNGIETILGVIAGLPSGTPAAFEAAFGWRWLVKLLEGYGFAPHLVHPLQCKAIASARLKNDKVDAAILAQLLRADLLPEAWIAPPAVRQLRALLRHRAQLVRLRKRVRQVACRVERRRRRLEGDNQVSLAWHAPGTTDLEVRFHAGEDALRGLLASRMGEQPEPGAGNDLLDARVRLGSLGRIGKRARRELGPPRVCGKLTYHRHRDERVDAGTRCAAQFHPALVDDGLGTCLRRANVRARRRVGRRRLDRAGSASASGQCGHHGERHAWHRLANHVVHRFLRQTAVQEIGPATGRVVKPEYRAGPGSDKPNNAAGPCEHCRYRRDERIRGQQPALRLPGGYRGFPADDGRSPDHGETS